MRKIKMIIMAVALLMSATVCAQTTSSGTSSSKKSSISSTIGNMLEGIFTRTDLSVKDLEGEYQSAGPAVAFKGENFLQKAGGIAGAAALESKLQPYYEQYGLVGMPFVVDEDGNFTLTIKRINVKGTLEKNDNDGTFIFNIMMGSMRLGKFTAYVEKTGRNLDLMFDATKLKELISTVGAVSGIKMAKTLASILDSYEGACIGFQMNYTGGGASSVDEGSSNDSTVTGKSGVESLLEILNKRRR